MGDALIEIRDVSHTFQTKGGPLKVLDHLDISVPEGGFCAVVGPSGCGKSTLTRLIAGLMIPDAGEVWLHGERVRGPRSTVGMAFQNPVLLEWRTILKNVLLPLEIVPSKLSRKEAEERARFLLSLVGLEGFEDKKPSELSGGMRQRASLCRALIHQPEVLILDEPFGALDAFTREDLWQTMHQVKEREPFTGVLITHDLRESIFLADQVVVMSGRPAHAQFVLEVGETGPRDLDHLYTAEAAEMLNVLRHQIEIAQGRAPAEPTAHGSADRGEDVPAPPPGPAAQGVA
ncbi:MAG: NitT/TauT family transport system ATP-binding protein [Rhodobacteraceae bacterium HLUCCA09]|nr:MAG: NitT/TauT family transport system ATP-binding protein [Rhodobacteraceae bacterium HLUCCA09]